MSATLTTSTATLHGGNGSPLPNGRRIKWLAGRGDPVALSVAKRLGLRPKTVERLMAELPAQVEAIIQSFHGANAAVRLERWFSRIKRAYEQRKVFQLTPALSQKANEADAAEETAVLRFWQTGTDRDLSMAIRAKDQEIAYAIMERDAMKAEEDRRLRLA